MTMSPYMEPADAEFFKKKVAALKSDAKITEWGSGGSTLTMLDMLKPKQRLTSVEHDLEWAKKVTDILKEHKKNSQVRYIITGLVSLKSEKDGVTFLNTDYEHHKTVMMGRFFEENPSFIGNYIDPTVFDKSFLDIWDSDFFFVDGLARGAVLATIKIKATKKNPLIMLHDYPGRELQYDWAIRLFPKTKQVGNFILLTI